MVISALILSCFISFVPQAETKPKASGEVKTKPSAQKEGGTFALRAKHVYTAKGGIIENGIVIISGGKIVAIGPDLPIPAGATEVSAECITPGLIDANASGGEQFGAIEDSSEINPNFRIADNIDAEDPAFVRLSRSGVTTGFFAPENRSVIGGLAAIVKTTPGLSPIIINPEAALKGAFGADPTLGNFTPRGFGLPNNFRVRRPGSRPATVLEIRLALIQAQKMVGKLGIVPPDFKPLVDVFEMEKQVRFHAYYLVELRSALRVIREFGLKHVTIDGAADAYHCADEIKAAGVNIVLHPFAREPLGGRNGLGRGIDYGDEKPAQDVLARLAAAGIPVALSAHGAAVEDDLAQQMRFAVRYGATRDLALRSVTLSAAEILGIQDRVGSIETGKDADLVLWSGDPFEFTSAPTQVFINGTPVWKRK
ncbi:MAG: amidohydrolase family protein [Planctomycetota bacterium]